MRNQFRLRVEGNHSVETEVKVELGGVGHQVSWDANISLLPPDILWMTFEQVDEDESGLAFQRDQTLNRVADQWNDQFVDVVDANFQSPIE